MSEIKEGDVRTYRGVLVFLFYNNRRSHRPDGVEGVFLWEDAEETPFDADGEWDLDKIPKHVLREAWGRTCEVTVRFADDEVDVIDLKVLPTRKEQVARVLRLAAEMIPNCGGDVFTTLSGGGVIFGGDVWEDASYALHLHLQRTGRRPGAGTAWNAYKAKSSPERVDPDVLLAEQVQALLATADEVEKGEAK